MNSKISEPCIILPDLAIIYIVSFFGESHIFLHGLVPSDILDDHLYVVKYIKTQNIIEFKDAIVAISTDAGFCPSTV